MIWAVPMTRALPPPGIGTTCFPGSYAADRRSRRRQVRLSHGSPLAAAPGGGRRPCPCFPAGLRVAAMTMRAVTGRRVALLALAAFVLASDATPVAALLRQIPRIRLAGRGRAGGHGLRRRVRGRCPADHPPGAAGTAGPAPHRGRPPWRARPGRGAPRGPRGGRPLRAPP